MGRSVSVLAGTGPSRAPYSADADGDGARGGIGVVLSHGFTGTPASVRPWAEYLAAAGFSVRAPLLPGHGTTWQDGNRFGWRDWLATLEAAHDDLRARCSHVFACGLSMGGTLVTRLAEQRPDEVAGLVLVNPSFATERVAAKFARYLSWAVRSRPGIGGDVKKPGAPEPAYDRTPVRAFVSLQQLWQVTVADLGRLTAPVRLYRSMADHVVEPLSAKLLLTRTTATDVDEIVLENSYHVATLDYDAPDIFAGTVQFIDSVLAPTVPTVSTP